MYLGDTSHAVAVINKYLYLPVFIPKDDILFHVHEHAFEQLDKVQIKQTLTQ